MNNYEKKAFLHNLVKYCLSGFSVICHKYLLSVIKLPIHYRWYFERDKIYTNTITVVLKDLTLNNKGD